MPLPIIADVMRVAVKGTAPNGHHWANILHFRKSGALTFTAAETVLDPILLSHYITPNGGGLDWQSYAPTTSHLDSFDYTPLDGTSATRVITHTDAGSNAGEALPASVALVVTLRTGLRGRSNRGRVYTGPWNEGTNQPTGVPQAATAASVATQWTNFLTALVGSGVSLVVASYLNSTATDVTTCNVDTRWDTQRRRLNA